MKILNLYACLGGNRYKWNEVAKEAGIEITKVGMVSDRSELKFGDNDTISLLDLNDVFESCIPALMAG